jgi:hypothetical protein
MKQGVNVAPTTATIETDLRETWLPDARGTLKASTAALYETIIDTPSCRISVPGSSGRQGLPPERPLRDPRHVPPKNGKPLAAKTIRNVHTLLHRAWFQRRIRSRTGAVLESAANRVVVTNAGCPGGSRHEPTPYLLGGSGYIA